MHPASNNWATLGGHGSSTDRGCIRITAERSRGAAGELSWVYLDKVGDAGVERAGHVVSVRQRLDVQQQLHCAHAPLVQRLVVEFHLRHHKVCQQGRADTDTCSRCYPYIEISITNDTQDETPFFVK